MRKGLTRVLPGPLHLQMDQGQREVAVTLVLSMS